MANTTRPRHPKLVRIIALVLLALIVIVGLVVLIAWLVVRPKRLFYTIEDGLVQNFHLYNNHLNSTFDFLIKAHNPNHRVSVYYDMIEVSVEYDGQTVAFNMLAPFYQPRRNVTALEAKLEARDITLSKNLAKDLGVEKSSGELKLVVRVKARIRFKVGVFKFKHRSLKVLCSPVVMHFSSSRSSMEMTYCDLDF